ncbi:hypothetical protein VTH06DRAFT_2379 [Thermothelomyces fergusii]
MDRDTNDGRSHLRLRRWAAAASPSPHHPLPPPPPAGNGGLADAGGRSWASSKSHDAKGAAESQRARQGKARQGKVTSAGHAVSVSKGQQEQEEEQEEEGAS